MEKILFILNPVAGGGRAKGLIPLIDNVMKKHNKNYKIKLTTRPKEAIELAEESVDKYDIIVAVGGDGTVNEVARGLINRGKGILGIIPGGTGNDLARSLDIDMDPMEALETLSRGAKKEIDIGRINQYKFLNISSIGFDAEVVVNNITIKQKIKSGFSYAISVVYTLLTFKSKKVRIKIDDIEIEEDILLLAIGNGKYYGGGMKILPTARVDDGYLHVCVIPKIAKLLLLILFPTIFNGKHIKFKKLVNMYKGKTVTVKTEDPLILNLDGEIYPKAKEIEFSLDNNKLKVICEKK